MSLRVAVVGAGVNGLSTALQVLNNIQDAVVTVIADSFSPWLTSNVAGGLWYLYNLGDTPEDLLRKWGKASFDHFLGLLDSVDGGVAGIQLVPGYQLFTEQSHAELPCSDVYMSYRSMSDREMSRFPGCKSGRAVTSVLAEGDKYLPYLMDKIRNKGGKFYQRKITNLEELFGDFDVVMICCGAFSKDVVPDTHIDGARGQTIRMYAPWLKTFIILDNGEYYIIPGTDRVSLGGTFQVGRYDREISLQDKQQIFQECSKLVPSLRKARHIEDLVGIRPKRSSVRLEKEEIIYNGRQKLVVHNYGHSGSGVTLSWGCATDAADLVKQWREKHPKAKL